MRTQNVKASLLLLWPAMLAIACSALTGQGPTATETPPNPATVAAPPTLAAGLWRPAIHTSWQIQYNGPLDLSLDVDMYNLDLFDTDAAMVAALHGQGRRVVCYFSAGSWEDWRPDAGQYPESVKGHDLDGWPGEQWLDIRQLAVLRPIIEARLDLCRAKGFDAADPDNVDGYINDTGFPLSDTDQLVFNRFLASAAHARGLSIGLKNDLQQIPDLVDDFDWALNEQCFALDECELLLPFITAGKAVFNIEYDQPASEFCPRAIALNINSLRKNLDLDVYREACE